VQVVLPDIETRATFELHAGRPMGDDEFFEFCVRNPELRIERSAGGEIIIMPPAGFETGYRNNELCRQLGNWARADGRGVALDSNTEYLLPDGSALSPDASWVERSRLDRFTREQKKRFLPLCPEFVVELTSPSGRLSNVRTKMKIWTDNGVQLGWLLDADVRTAYIYRPQREPEELRDADFLLGEGPVAGFRLELSDIWKGL
jgi:Uma2 family endonuclease